MVTGTQIDRNQIGQGVLMSFSSTSRMYISKETQICRILNGMWQVSGAHGHIDPDTAIKSMIQHHDLGFTTWDLADHYGPAEDFIKLFRNDLAKARGASSLDSIQAFTKWVPKPGPMTKAIVEANIDLSVKRMGVPSLDMLQFHWWDYQDDRYLDALQHLVQLRQSGKIRDLSVTNFDTKRLKIMADNNITITSNQVQFSLIDRRPEVEMIKFCNSQEIKLLTYGTLCGGLLTSKFLGAPEPSDPELTTASLRKYKQMIDVWGGWPLFQKLLSILNDIAQEKQSSISNIAVKYILDQPQVAGVILGVRLGQSSHINDNANTFDLNLNTEDRKRIEFVLAQSEDLYARVGDCGDEYRNRF